MSLPIGFNPEDGTLRKVGNTVRTIMPTPIQTPSRNYRSYGTSWWDDFNDGIASIGQWLQEIGASVIALIITAIPTLIAAFLLLKWNIGVFSDNGFILGVLSLFADIFVVGIGYYAFCIVFGLIYAVFFILGFVFYNAYSLIITIVLGLGIWLWVSLSDGTSQSKNHYKHTTVVESPAYTDYRCTASKLNVRSAPSENARVIGTVLKGNVVKVYGFEGDFARIEWETSTAYEYAYVSRKYIAK